MYFESLTSQIRATYYTIISLKTGIFLTSAVEKTKNQAQNSSQTLKKKLKLWEAFPKKVNNSRQKLNFDLFSRGW